MTQAKVYYVKIGLLSADLVSSLPIEYAEHAWRYRLPEDAFKSGGGCKLLLYALSDRNCAQLTYTDDGRPFVDSNTYVSVSHSDSLIVAAVSDTPCGVDTETSGAVKSDLAPRILDSFNLSVYNSLSEDDKSAFLTEQWCLREAYVKCGEGAALTSLSKIEVRKADGKICVGNGYTAAVTLTEDLQCIALVTKSERVTFTEVTDILG